MHTVVLVTSPSAEFAASLARTLVEERLAACANLVPQIRSIYRWQGEICDDAETLLILKTTTARYPELEARIQELHPYDVPEVIQLPIQAGSAAYLGWLVEQTTPDPDRTA